MSGWLKVIAYALLIVFLGVILKEIGFKGSKLVAILGTVAIIGVCVASIGEILSSFSPLWEGKSEYVSAMIKIVGIGYAFGICSDICTELGEVAMSNTIMLFGRLEIISISVPFIKRIIEKGIEMI